MANNNSTLRRLQVKPLLKEVAVQDIPASPDITMDNNSLPKVLTTRLNRVDILHKVNLKAAHREVNMEAPELDLLRSLASSKHSSSVSRRSSSKTFTRQTLRSSTNWHKRQHIKLARSASAGASSLKSAMISSN
jgi:hypothetical protein